jgi:GTP-binding protein
MYEWIVYQGYRPIIIATKLDKINRSQRDRQVKIIKEGLGASPDTKIFPFSSLTKQGRDEIWEYVETYLFSNNEDIK